MVYKGYKLSLKMVIRMTPSVIRTTWGAARHSDTLISIATLVTRYITSKLTTTPPQSSLVHDHCSFVDNMTINYVNIYLRDLDADKVNTKKS